jgi:hypothetical protein
LCGRTKLLFLRQAHTCHVLMLPRCLGMRQLACAVEHLVCDRVLELREATRPPVPHDAASVGMLLKYLIDVGAVRFSGGGGGLVCVNSTVKCGWRAQRHLTVRASPRRAAAIEIGYRPAPPPARRLTARACAPSDGSSGERFTSCATRTDTVRPSDHPPCPAAVRARHACGISQIAILLRRRAHGLHQMAIL